MKSLGEPTDWSRITLASLVGQFLYTRENPLRTGDSEKRYIGIIFDVDYQPKKDLINLLTSNLVIYRGDQTGWDSISEDQQIAVEYTGQSGLMVNEEGVLSFRTKAKAEGRIFSSANYIASDLGLPIPKIEGSEKWTLVDEPAPTP